MELLRFAYLAIIFLISETLTTGSLFGVSNFLLPSLLMGVGVAIDVFLATIAKFQDDNLAWKSWTLPVTITHTLFPALGYFSFWFIGEYFPALHTIHGIIGYTLISLFVYEVLSEAAGYRPVISLSRVISNWFDFSTTDARTLIAILAVSWDALWSGPALAAQAVASNWTLLQVVISFAIAGLVVAIMAELGLSIARLMRSVRFKTGRTLARFTLFGIFIQLSVISGFGLLALWYAFDAAATIYISILAASLLLAILFVVFKKQLWQTQLKEARQSLGK